MLLQYSILEGKGKHGEDEQQRTKLRDVLGQKSSRVGPVVNK